MNLIKKVLKFLQSPKKIAILAILILIGGFLIWKNTGNQSPVQYQTAEASKGTLVTSISASGQITTANNVQITIQSSGAVKEVFVKNDDQVYQGQTIATLTLDQSSQQKQAAAWASYLSAKNSLDSAQTKIYSLQAAAFKANQAFINGAVARELKTNDPTYIQENATWLQAEADYKNQANIITQAQASLGSAALTLSQTSSTITAPIAGVVKGLTITPGAIITLSSSSSSSGSTSQVLGSINQPGSLQAQVNISEIDVTSVKEGQKVTMTLDAFPGKTFTGKVASINTNGVTSSGVTTYPAVISFDSSDEQIYPNMAVSAKIITKIKNDVLLIPSGAIQTQNNQTSVRILKNNQLQTVSVETGDFSDTQTEITSGLLEGDQVVTSIISSQTAGQSSSPFSSSRSGSGGAFRIMGGGR